MTTWISRTYEGATQSEALVRFAADAQAAERSGYRPAQQVWHEADGAHRLIVAFKRVSLAPRSPGGGRVPDVERIASFRRVLGSLSTDGWEVVQASDFQAVIRNGHGLQQRTHVIHLLLTLGTAGVWGIVWLLHFARHRTWRRIIAIDESGVIAAGVYTQQTTKPPRLGPPISASGAIELPLRQRLVTLSPGVMVTIATTLLCEVETEQLPPIWLERVDKLPTRYYDFEVYLSGNAEPGAALTWFIMN